MSWVTQVWSVAAGACFALAGVHFMVWLRSRESASSLLFAVAAISGGAIALLDISLMRSRTPEEYGEVLRWMQALSPVLVIAMVWFIRLHLRAGRLWLAWTISGLRVSALLANFMTSSPNATFREITGLRFVPWLGEVLSIPIGEPTQWRWLIHASTALLLIYVLDAGVTAWKGGDRRRAVVLCGAISGAIVLSFIISQLMVWQVLPGPFIGLIFLLVVLAMGTEISIDLIRAQRTTAELRRSEARIRLAAVAARLGLWEWDVVRDRVWGTRAGLAQSGIANGDGLTFEGFLQSVHTDDRGAVRQAIRRVLEDGESVDIEYRMVGSADGLRWISARGEVERGPDGRPLHVRGVTIDITRQKRMDAELHEQRDRLAHVQRVSALGQLSAALAHEISQPLGAILRNAEAGELFIARVPPDIDELRAILVDIRRDEQRAAAIIERMRSYLKPRGAVIETLDLKELVEQVATFLKAEFRAHHATLALDLPRTLPQVRGDRIQLQQVVMNLLLNSLEALDDAPPERRAVAIRVTSTAAQLEIAVMDNGPGIAPDRLEEVLEPFMSTKKTGTGIGLAICKTIVATHRGRIWAENNPDGGATLRFTLPAVREVNAP